MSGQAAFLGRTTREEFGITMPRSELGDHEPVGATTPEQPGDDAFAAAWDAGHAMPLKQAIKYALEDT